MAPSQEDGDMQASELRIPSSVVRALAGAGATIVVPAQMPAGTANAVNDALDRLDRQAQWAERAVEALFPGGVDAPDLVAAGAALADAVRALGLVGPPTARTEADDELPEEILAGLGDLVDAADDNRSADVRGEVEATIMKALCAAREAGARDALLAVVVQRSDASATAGGATGAPVAPPFVAAGWDVDLGSRVFVVTAPDPRAADFLFRTDVDEDVGASDIDHAAGDPSVIFRFDSDPRSDSEIHAALAAAVAAFVGGPRADSR
jgi:hypothetical protein